MKRKQAMILAMALLTSVTAPALVSSVAATVQADTGRVSAEETDGSASGENAPVNGESDTCGAAKDFSEMDRLVEEAEREGNAAVPGTEIAEELYGASGSSTNTEDMVPMYRLYHPHSYEHFYTAAKNERETLISRGWIDEGIGWYAPKEGKPVYRLVNLFTADHHYTTSEHERDTLETMGWRYEGECWKTADETTGIPVYRQCHPGLTTGAHNYTTDEHERNVLCGVGWVDEQVGFYASAKGKSASELEKETWQKELNVDTSKFVYENITIDEAELLGGIILHEAGTHAQGMYCVGQVVLNRLRDYRTANKQLGRKAYPSTIAEVLGEPYQFMDVDDLRDCIRDYKKNQASAYKTAFNAGIKLLQGDKTGENLIGTKRKNFWSDWYAQKCNYNHCEDPVFYGGNTFFIWK
uniref:Cell Wall Hydrolase n=1 Tax=Eubacterium cellulosolvens (strain ATCC 43171 / JCM 9499 / 6) TaxID=633697 RepID=I5AVD6_EUBC6